jgi:hypothetical protein
MTSLESDVSMELSRVEARNLYQMVLLLDHHERLPIVSQSDSSIRSRRATTENDHILSDNVLGSKLGLVDIAS